METVDPNLTHRSMVSKHRSIQSKDIAETMADSSRKYISILDLDLSASITQSYKDVITSPRTKEAMANLGILP